MIFPWLIKIWGLLFFPVEGILQGQGGPEDPVFLEIGILEGRGRRDDDDFADALGAVREIIAAGLDQPGFDLRHLGGPEQSQGGELDLGHAVLVAEDRKSVV